MSKNKNTEKAEVDNKPEAGGLAAVDIKADEQQTDTKPEQKNKPSKQDEETPVQSKASPTNKVSNGILYVLLLLITIAFSGAAYYLWDIQQQQLATSLGQINAAQSQLSNLNSQLSQNTSSIALQEKSLQALNLNLAETTEISQQAMQLLQQDQRGWALAEIDYLLRMAHRRLQVARDIKGAIAALKGADSRIQQLGDLRLFKIRKQLNKDIADLNAIRQADTNGIAMNIDRDIALLPELPFKSLETEITSQLTEEQQLNQAAEKSFVGSVIDTVKNIGDIKIYKQDVKVVNSDENQKIIIQSLQSHLLGARLAALSFNDAQFHYEINNAVTLLSQHYDAQDNRVDQLIEQLSAYIELQLEPALPELTKAWELLQTELATKAVDKETEK